MISVNRGTMRRLDEVALRNASRGPVQLFVGNNLPWLFRGNRRIEKAVVDEYIQNTKRVTSSLGNVVVQAQALAAKLESLEAETDKIVNQETGQKSKDGVLQRLWTMLGGDERIIAEMDREMKLLERHWQV
ncbi:MAG: hypothetical protein M1816_006495 [Peltula sp. TS41687]|nr:MAG: hypothetical protein M1816_006495 [Peltula sp. TS41687]